MKVREGHYNIRNIGKMQTVFFGFVMRRAVLENIVYKSDVEEDQLDRENTVSGL